MMAMTTSNSISVKAERRLRNCMKGPFRSEEMGRCDRSAQTSTQLAEELGRCERGTAGGVKSVNLYEMRAARKQPIN
jgi:hypothetical protein